MASSPTTQGSTRERLLRAQAASHQLGQLSTAQKDLILLSMAESLEVNSRRILAANSRDLEESGLTGAMRDRLLLNHDRIRTMAQGVRDVAQLPDPAYEILAEWTRPNLLRIRKVRVPLGVVAIIYESRPNVTVDAAALAFKTGNAIVLRGGKEAAHSNQSLVDILCEVDGVPPGAVELLDSSSRDSVHELVRARGLIDVLIPRGGPALISYVIENATVPVIETGAGNCHIFVDQFADLDMADAIVINAKTQRPSVCNAAEKLLVHQNIATEYIPRIVEQLIAAGVEIRGDQQTCLLASAKSSAKLKPATEQDWGEEYLRLCIAIRVVDTLEEAIAHINRHSTKNSEAIVTGDQASAERFLRLVDSASVFWNASTRFSDGGEFGFGAEMGISTQKLHCRGPFALAELTSIKYEVIGTGQVR
jgi:glutamate-5-semialdehyde dehydrogenase